MKKEEELLENREDKLAEFEESSTAETPKVKVAKAQFGLDGSGQDNDQNQP